MARAYVDSIDIVTSVVALFTVVCPLYLFEIIRGFYMRDVTIRLSILLCGSLLFFYFLRTVSLSIASSIVLALFFIGIVVYCDPDLLLMLQEYRKLKYVSEKSIEE
ncbi:MAG: hypothetical protein Greene07147_911 [Parcubacteria group bacterium Greene0714_7]|nr:MAG: hypothetical protein Greene041614_1066 [Parcubacteria group bacterium Greene0416_14]TSC99890.1 MAG: hypothetical protein Greene101415_1040 [Parcubacteria group bacterium Greene1014_15]TSD04788.1 MAG: hypothetical protein Greene07147_911 [Parcubacteria group bacterium Greene0714_7]